MDINKYKRLIKKSLPTDSKLNRVEIIILKYKLPEVEIKCVSEIIKRTNYPYKLNLFDCRKFSGNMAKMWNKFIKESTCDYLLIIDSDAFVMETGDDSCWLTKMMQTLLKEEDIGIVLPVSRQATATCQTMAGDKSAQPFEVFGPFSGYCFLFKKKIIKDIGYFDEEFYIFGQDSDWAQRIHENPKWRALCDPRVEILHGELGFGGNASTNKAATDGEYDKRIELQWAKKLFQEKKLQRNGDEKLKDKVFLRDENLEAELQ